MGGDAALPKFVWDFLFFFCFQHSAVDSVDLFHERLSERCGYKWHGGVVLLSVSAVETRSSSSSCRYYGDLVVDAAQSSGYLANIVTDEQSFGSSRCPWIVTAPRGQRLNVSLLDFGLARRHETIAASPPGLGSGASGPVDGLQVAAGGVCHVYAKISERGAATSDITVRMHTRSLSPSFLFVGGGLLQNS